MSAFIGGLIPVTALAASKFCSGAVALDLDGPFIDRREIAADYAMTTSTI